MKSFLVAIVGLASLALAAPTELVERQSVNTVTDNYLFSLSIDQFIAKRNARDPATLDWSSDGCSSSPDNPFGFDFLNSCYRHDFGYRNFKKQSRFNDANKARIDSNFKKDMYAQCAKETFEGPCKLTADLYYAAVKEFGQKRAAEILAARLQFEAEAAKL